MSNDSDMAIRRDELESLSATPGFSRNRRLLLTLALILFVTFISAVLLPVGFQGRDDFRYLVAAERWMQEGVHLGENHWASRLPFVFAYVLSFMTFGKSEAALTVLHSVLFVVIALTAWGFGRRAFGEGQAALCGVIVALFTPLLFRIPTTYYPEGLEIALTGVCAWLVLERDRYTGSKRIAVLVIAGLIGGTAILVRQTSAAVALALAAVIVLHGSDRPLLKRIEEVGFLALGFTLPIIAEMAFYTALTGNPLQRLAIDSNHVKIPSASLRGKVYEGSDGVLFNWELASRWDKGGLIETHWALMPLVRLFFSPGMMLTPWFAVAGGVLAWMMGRQARVFATLTFFVFFFSYVINTFVIVIAPNTRYFGLALLMMCPLAGLALLRSFGPRLAIPAVVILFVSPAVLITSIQPRPVDVTNGVEALALRAAEPVYLTERFAAGTALRRNENRRFAELTRVGPAPVGGLVPWGAYDPSAFAGETCRNGRPAFTEVSRHSPAAPIAATVRFLGLEPFVPQQIMRYAQRDSDTVALLRRQC